MSNLATKRIHADIKLIKTGILDNENIYVDFNESDIFKARALVIGPPIKDSPYVGGFYFFDIEFPKNYPLSPPKVKFMTLYDRVRFNPNLYKCGKVCLSILNTWSGPGWTTAQNLYSVLISLQSLLHEFPIQNEPGWERETGKKSEDYNNVLAFFNIKVAVINMIEKTPKDFEVFKDIMIQYLVKNFNKYNEFIDKYVYLDKQTLRSGIYDMTVDYNIKDLQEKLLMLYSEYDSIYSDN